MHLEGKHVVVTGGGSGIGKALCHAFVKAGARIVVVADINEDAAREVAGSVGGTAAQCDVSREDKLKQLIEMTEERHGPIDLFCSNAGIAAGFTTDYSNVAAAGDEVWNRAWQINVMAHIYAARQLVPRMRGRGGGYFLNTISAAGLLSQIGSAVYATTKHAAVGFAETLAFTHREDGIRVSILCPQGVDTPMLHGLPSGPQSRDGVLTAETVAEAAVDGIVQERFYILPHPKVQKYIQGKADDVDRWLRGMARLQAEIQKSSLP